MNAATQLLTLLDQVFGFKDKIRSKYKKVQQYYDEQTNETVILLEYRVRSHGMIVPKDVVGDRQKQNLMRQVNVMAQAIENRKKKEKKSI
jgi:hypothetical protein